MIYLISKTSFSFSHLLYKFLSLKCYSIDPELNLFYKKFILDVKKSRIFLKNNPDFVLSRADKRNASVDEQTRISL